MRFFEREALDVSQNLGTGTMEPVVLDLPDEYKSSRENTPFVVVAGWLGAKDRNVKKYTDELRAMGCVTLRSIQGSWDCFSPFASGRRKFARRLLTKAREARAELGMSKSPLYLMFMSNGGCWSHATMTQCGMLEPGGEFEDLGPHLKGRVFDSSPARMTLRNGPKVVCVSMGVRNTAVRAVVHALFYVYAVVAFLVVVAATGSTTMHIDEFWRTCASAPRNGRELYLYSDADELTEPGPLSELIAARKCTGTSEEGCDIVEMRWKDSRHCAHLIDERDEYLDTLRGFIV